MQLRILFLLLLPLGFAPFLSASLWAGEPSPAPDLHPGVTPVTQDGRRIPFPMTDSAGLDQVALKELTKPESERLREQKKFLLALPTQRPMPGFFVKGFGIETKSGRKHMHEGLDIQATKPGTPVRATAVGRVTFVGADDDAKTDPEFSTPGAVTVFVDPGYGLETAFRNLRSANVRVGERVKRGTVLGTSGEKPLHYEIRIHGTPVDPATYILEK